VSQPARRSRARWLGTAVGLVLVVACVVFVGRRLATEWDAARDALASASWGWLALGVLLAAAAMATMADGWRRVLATLGAPVGAAAAQAWYFVGEIGKYLPGSVWPLIGRAELARRGGVPRAVAYQSVALSLLLLYLAAVPVGAGVVGPIGVALGIAGLLALHPAVVRRLLDLARRLTGRRLELVVPTVRQSLVLAAGYLPTWLLVGTAMWAIPRALDPSAGWVEVVPAAAASWLVGFAAVPVPGGVGVREATFVAAATGLAAGVAPATAVVARLVFVAVDAAGAAALAARARR
jgi:glycosyltransferase 2 family protein